MPTIFHLVILLQKYARHSDYGFDYSNFEEWAIASILAIVGVIIGIAIEVKKSESKDKQNK